VSKRESNPSQLRRVAANRPLAVAYATLAVLAVTGSLAPWGTSNAVTDALDKSWRGAYDILVTPGGQAGSEGGQGLVDANFATATSGANVSGDQVSAIRHVPGVDVAAPIGSSDGSSRPASIRMLRYPCLRRLPATGSPSNSV
jgi:hypothetical protein